MSDPQRTRGPIDPHEHLPPGPLLHRHQRGRRRGRAPGGPARERRHGRGRRCRPAARRRRLRGRRAAPGQRPHHYWVVVHAVDVETLGLEADVPPAQLGFQLFTRTRTRARARATLVATYDRPAEAA